MSTVAALCGSSAAAVPTEFSVVSFDHGNMSATQTEVSLQYRNGDGQLITAKFSVERELGDTSPVFDAFSPNVPINVTVEMGATS